MTAKNTWNLILILTTKSLSAIVETQSIKKNYSKLIKIFYFFIKY